jgi:hypothetical protein
MKDDGVSDLRGVVFEMNVIPRKWARGVAIAQRHRTVIPKIKSMKLR